ncbi:bifunctional nicotinamidase/pyrazinamidase [Desulforhopalus sp. IMCC35007]|uniref:bifunctional nicotinamidase/pyrazinamidase n=1 Tax=Desulforhopalus sp. IMCC35007 TaxID=2569543 RepID=UPI0010AE7E0B|nr:bifunctional nicotinamidase/pyrazinamidase [Desulforhopalus sp. IMCC35007]TKB05912.1 bifunctional nicotinamidase/pyrazinamidase [Desulforhopalus sp. IMCC35007]
MKRALLVVDIQNDFLPGGALAVPEGNTILPFVVELLQTGKNYDLIVVTQDWHPPGHGSFASSHNGAEPFQLGELSGLPQMLWPDHCVEKTKGARLSLDIEKAVETIQAAGRPVLTVKKGQHRGVDSYSAFFDNARLHDTGLQSMLVERGINGVDVVGLAFDYCVKATAIDAVSLGFKTRVLLQGTRPVDPSAETAVVGELAGKGVVCVAEV